MENYNKQKIINAVNAVYRDTDDTGLYTSEVRFRYVKPEYYTVVHDEIVISRSIRRDDLTYKLYTKHDDKPLMTVFGCWPQEFVSDVFIRALEHFYDDYSELKFCKENENVWVRY
jgi:hypothetical protein